jgi:hypothetical protein
MSSSLTWLDHDNAARERSHRLLQMFKESETRDELGIGAIRDSISDQLFPGTSVIQTRLRYMLLLPWLFMQMESEGVSAAKFSKIARERELALNDRLSAERGAFGRVMGHDLQRLASSVYWAGLGRWGLRVFQGTQQDYFRRIDSIYAARHRKQRRESGDWLDPLQGATWHATLRELTPDDNLEALLEHATLELSRNEAQFLREQWRRLHPNSLLSWLALDNDSLSNKVAADAPWLHPRKASFPVEMRELVEHGRLFSKLVEGAALIYNLYLSEVWKRSERVDAYRVELTEWAATVRSSGLADWKMQDFWLSVMGRNHTITPRTQHFIESWWRLVNEAPSRLLNSKAARELIRHREEDMKGARSRFKNAGNWGGSSGLTVLTFRWGIASDFLSDLAAGLGRKQ